jgi:hypothetical protein
VAWAFSLEYDFVQEEKENDHNRGGSKDKQASKHFHRAVIRIFWWDFSIGNNHIGLVGLSVPVAKGGINLLTLGSVIRQRPQVFVTKIYHMTARFICGRSRRSASPLDNRNRGLPARSIDHMRHARSIKSFPKQGGGPKEKRPLPVDKLLQLFSALLQRRFPMHQTIFGDATVHKNQLLSVSHMIDQHQHRCPGVLIEHFLGAVDNQLISVRVVHDADVVVDQPNGSLLRRGVADPFIPSNHFLCSILDFPVDFFLKGVVVLQWAKPKNFGLD